ncbi:STAS/SEC14 domain-containing protein [Arthrobacter sp. B1805]|uniref:STAS/SEC14 domain-containing protein n=1 Tax=Arthrobacter sp. B1805 TaxID=2058892 RepID=UPI000CE4B089|nr:STAS/SEC14 domain-containing protein [Arthrobacter sp. B1805]
MITGDGARFELTVEQGFNRLRWSPNVTTISGEDVQATADAFETVFGPDRRPLLVHVGALGGITAQARQMLLEGTHPTRVAILSADLVTKVITAFAYAAVRPTRLFSDETEAIRWLLDALPEPKPEHADADPSPLSH